MCGASVLSLEPRGLEEHEHAELSAGVNRILS